MRSRRSWDMRYVGQNYELSVLLESGTTLPPVTELRNRFEAAHEAKYGHSDEDAPVEIVNVRLRAGTAYDEGAEPVLRAGTAEAARTVLVWFDTSRPVETAVIHRDSLAAGASLAGPAIVTQFDSTTVLPPGCTARVDGARNIVIEVSP